MRRELNFTWVVAVVAVSYVVYWIVKGIMWLVR